MAKKVYNKTPTSYNEQVKLLKSRGLVTNDKERVIRYLQQISYYRLSAYFLPYQKTKDKFNKSTTFDLIIETYKFDSKTLNNLRITKASILTCMIR